MTRHDLMLCTCALSSNLDIIDYTYKHETLGHYSLIDYFMVNVDMMHDIKNYDIVDNALNLSDHNPITISLCWNIDINLLCNDPQSNPSLAQSNQKSNHAFLRWDHAFLPNYYYGNRELLQPITSKFKYCL